MNRNFKIRQLSNEPYFSFENFMFSNLTKLTTENRCCQICKRDTNVAYIYKDVTYYSHYECLSLYFLYQFFHVTKSATENSSGADDNIVSDKDDLEKDEEDTDAENSPASNSSSSTPTYTSLYTIYGLNVDETVAKERVDEDGEERVCHSCGIGEVFFKCLVDGCDNYIHITCSGSGNLIVYTNPMVNLNFYTALRNKLVDVSPNANPNVPNGTLTNASNTNNSNTTGTTTNSMNVDSNTNANQLVIKDQHEKDLVLDTYLRKNIINVKDKLVSYRFLLCYGHINPDVINNIKEYFLYKLMVVTEYQHLYSVINVISSHTVTGPNTKPKDEKKDDRRPSTSKSYMYKPQGSNVNAFNATGSSSFTSINTGYSSSLSTRNRSELMMDNEQMAPEGFVPKREQGMLRREQEMARREEGRRNVLLINNLIYEYNLYRRSHVQRTNKPLNTTNFNILFQPVTNSSVTTPTGATVLGIRDDEVLERDIRLLLNVNNNVNSIYELKKITLANEFNIQNILNTMKQLMYPTPSSSTSGTPNRVTSMGHTSGSENSGLTTMGHELREKDVYRLALKRPKFVLVKLYNKFIWMSVTKLSNYHSSKNTLNNLNTGNDTTNSMNVDSNDYRSNSNNSRMVNGVPEVTMNGTGNLADKMVQLSGRRQTDDTKIVILDYIVLSNLEFVYVKNIVNSIYYQNNNVVLLLLNKALVRRRLSDAGKELNGDMSNKGHSESKSDNDITKDANNTNTTGTTTSRNKDNKNTSEVKEAKENKESKENDRTKSRESKDRRERGHKDKDNKSNTSINRDDSKENKENEKDKGNPNDNKTNNKDKQKNEDDKDEIINLCGYSWDINPPLYKLYKMQQKPKQGSSSQNTDSPVNFVKDLVDKQLGGKEEQEESFVYKQSIALLSALNSINNNIENYKKNIESNILKDQYKYENLCFNTNFVSFFQNVSTSLHRYNHFKQAVRKSILYFNPDDSISTSFLGENGDTVGDGPFSIGKTSSSDDSNNNRSSKQVQTKTQSTSNPNRDSNDYRSNSNSNRNDQLNNHYKDTDRYNKSGKENKIGNKTLPLGMDNLKNENKNDPKNNKQKNENSNAVDVKTKQEHENSKENKENDKEKANQNEGGEEKVKISKEYCSVCLLSELSHKHVLMQCQKCYLRVHYKCYHNYLVPVGGTASNTTNSSPSTTAANSTVGNRPNAESNNRDNKDANAKLGFYCDPCSIEYNQRYETNYNSAICISCLSSGGAMKSVHVPTNTFTSSHSISPSARNQKTKDRGDEERWIHLICLVFIMPKVICYDFNNLSQWYIPYNYNSMSTCSICGVVGGIQVSCCYDGSCENKRLCNGDGSGSASDVGSANGTSLGLGSRGGSGNESGNSSFSSMNNNNNSMVNGAPEVTMNGTSSDRGFSNEKDQSDYRCDLKFHPMCCLLSGCYIKYSDKNTINMNQYHLRTYINNFFSGVFNKDTFNISKDVMDNWEDGVLHNLFQSILLEPYCMKHTAQLYGDKFLSEQTMKRCFAYTHYLYNPDGFKSKKKYNSLPIEPIYSPVTITRNGPIKSQPRIMPQHYTKKFSFDPMNKRVKHNEPYLISVIYGLPKNMCGDVPKYGITAITNYLSNTKNNSLNSNNNLNNANKDNNNNKDFKDFKGIHDDKLWYSKHPPPYMVNK